VLGQLDELERRGLPFGVRAHGFDWDREVIERLAAHPLCVGVWNYGAAALSIAAPGVHAMSPTCAAVHRWPEPLPSAERDLVLFAAAGLPKRDWPLLMEAMALLEGTERRICVAASGGFEQEIAAVIGEASDLRDPPLIQVNVTREEMGRLLARTAVALYTLVPDERFAEPMAIIDALAMGASVVVPDRPEAVAFAGAHARPYRTEHDIARHVREVLAGGGAIEAEHAANREEGRRRFSDPDYGRRFLEQLRDGLDRVRGTRQLMVVG
jgi:hypothetical protein